jgi:ABC-type branched-subunit amino acid transport system substrate-binding protein
MVSTRFSRKGFLRAAAAAAGLALIAACTPIQQAGQTGPAVDLSQPVKVALLVPLGSGDPGRDEIGRSLVNAARLAQNDLAGVPIELAVYEDGGTTQGGTSAATRAINEGARILVGPLFSTATAGAEPVAAQAGVPILSLSNNAEVAGNGVYLLGLTFENSADQLVAYGLSQGQSRMAVVYPRGLEGETARRAVEGAAQARGASLVASQSYDLSLQGIQTAAPGIAGVLNGAGANGVVLTDGPTGGLGFIADELRNNGVQAANVQFLGMQRWDNSAEALALPGLQGGVFTAPDPALVAAFRGRYRNAYGESPHELAGLAYDGIAAVGALISEARAQGGRDPFSAARITKPEGFAGVQGAFRLLPSGMNQRNLAILQVQNGSAVVVRRATGSLAAVTN